MPMAMIPVESDLLDELDEFDAALELPDETPAAPASTSTEVD